MKTRIIMICSDFKNDVGKYFVHSKWKTIDVGSFKMLPFFIAFCKICFSFFSYEFHFKKCYKISFFKLRCNHKVTAFKNKIYKCENLLKMYMNSQKQGFPLQEICENQKLNLFQTLIFIWTQIGGFNKPQIKKRLKQ